MINPLIGLLVRAAILAVSELSYQVVFLFCWCFKQLGGVDGNGVSV